MTQISFLGAAAGAITRVRVVGSRSGVHSGRLLAYSQGDGASFVSARPFRQGERVAVRADVRVEGHVRQLVDDFAIAVQDPITRTPERIHPGAPGEQQGFYSRPDLHPPQVTVTALAPGLAPGYEFTAPYAGPGQAGPLILDPNGAVVWFKPLPAERFATNLRVQEYLGRPALTWWQGDISVHGFGLGEDVIFNQSYSEVARVRAGNGLQADLHDFQLTAKGTALITAYDPILCNLSREGGRSRDGVTDGVLQEVDVKTGLVMFQWTSLDHVGLGESYAHARVASPGTPYDYFHINSINVDRDGSLLISGRNTWAAYDLDPRSGQILWRLGGKDSSFAMGPGTATAYQHDPRELADGAISMFDNGAAPKVHGQSRGIVIGLDLPQRTATLTTQLVHTPPLVAESQGNLQALANGDWFVGWGQVGDLSEFNSAGALLFDAHFPTYTQSYRDLRFTWTGTPAHAPVFVLRPAPGGAAVVYASWNGATQVSAWRVLAGATAGSLSPVAQVARAGFETSIALAPGASHGYVDVQALDASGRVLATAPTAKA
jgi:hypothetical protein